MMRKHVSGADFTQQQLIPHQNCIDFLIFQERVDSSHFSVNIQR